MLQINHVSNTKGVFSVTSLSSRLYDCVLMHMPNALPTPFFRCHANEPERADRKVNNVGFACVALLLDKVVNSSFRYFRARDRPSRAYRPPCITGGPGHCGTNPTEMKFARVRQFPIWQIKYMHLKV